MTYCESAVGDRQQINPDSLMPLLDTVIAEAGKTALAMKAPAAPPLHTTQDWNPLTFTLLSPFTSGVISSGIHVVFPLLPLQPLTPASTSGLVLWFLGLTLYPSLELLNLCRKWAAPKGGTLTEITNRTESFTLLVIFPTQFLTVTQNILTKLFTTEFQLYNFCKIFITTMKFPFLLNLKKVKNVDLPMN